VPTYSVFAYGTLQIAEVMRAVTGKSLKPIVATLTGYQRFKFKERTFPGIVKNKAYTIEGMLYKDIDEQTLGHLDHFEDIAYERCLLDVLVGNNTEKAFAYVTKDEYRDYLSDQEWDLEEFKRKYLKLYLRDISGF
jgi:gamma-glutamylcyclotransferase (GGCT)/AIG2-like uncharacterized protein YtfP